MKTKVIIKNTVVVKNPPDAVVSLLKTKLTYSNPQYVQAVKNGRYIPNSMPRTVQFYKERDSKLMVPKGYMHHVLYLLGSKTKVVDRTVAPDIDISFKGTLRPYQNKATKDILNRRFGVLKAATGSGKTVMGTFIASKRKTTTLVVVHNKELLYQWVDAFKQFTDTKEIGIIGDGKYKIKPITIGIVNSVTKKVDELNKEFGLVIYDECHRVVSPIWMNIINNMYCKYQLGLSATPYRSDKLTDVIFQLVGPTLHEVNKRDLQRTKAVLEPKIVRCSTQFEYRFNQDYAKMISKLTEDDARNERVINRIINDYNTYKEPIMVVSDRVSHCEILHKLLRLNSRIKTVVLSSKVPKKERKQVVEQLKNRKYDVLISTTSLLGEGFDAPILNALFLTTPIKFSGRLIQIVGRILRPSKGKQPRVYDFRDPLTPVLRFSGFSRDKVYKANGWNQ
jgi:superfamily II DNA or RNA helicase